MARVVRVGLGVFVLRRHDCRFLLGERRAAHGAGTWALPGGHLEFGESFEACAQREALEETGLVLQAPRFVHVQNSIMPAADKHYVSIFMAALTQEAAPEAQNLEPDKCAGWHWVSWDEVQQRVDQGQWTLFEPLLYLRPAVEAAMAALVRDANV